MKRSKPKGLKSLDDVVVIVIGDHVWGRGPDVATAVKNAGRPKKYLVFLAHADSSVDEVSGGILYPLGCPPREILRRGIPRGAPVDDPRTKSQRRQLVTIDEARPADKQHTKPCSDCPWARTSLNGWLGGQDPVTWLREAGTDHPIPCHTIKNRQCAGAAIYRANTCKKPRPGSKALVLPKDPETVFETPKEFMDHHGQGPATS